ncbi:MAG: hypothetical protein HZB51_20670 [Chloroflexi bacterium]|nr:hypothetical protein [Chloroflexota bacterium]
MYPFPNEPKKIIERIKRYERELRKEAERFGHISDDAGKRYLLGPLYLLVNDLKGAVTSFEWYARTFPDDMGEPFHYLCWALALYRSGDLVGASRRLRQAMLSNLYLLPHLLGIEQPKLNIRHGSNVDQKEYLQYLPHEFIELWDTKALQWARETFTSPESSRMRNRFIEIGRQLLNEPVGPNRKQLVAEEFELRRGQIGDTPTKK